MGKFYYVLSDKAEFDVDDIFEYSVSEFGMDVAIEYHFGLTALFVQLTEFPNEGKSRGEIKQGLRSIVFVSHIVFYRVLSDHIRIVRILHQSQDVYKFFQ